MTPDLLDWIEDYERTEVMWTNGATQTTDSSQNSPCERNTKPSCTTQPRAVNTSPGWTKLYGPIPEREMGLVATSKPSMNFETTPEGVHVGRCYRVVDLGTQTVKEFEGNGTRQVHQVMLSWELLGDQRMADGRPFSIHKTFTVSTHEKAGLRLTLEAWRGRKFTQEEVDHFDISKVLGVYGLLNVTHTIKGESVYANIASIMPLPKGMPKPEGVNSNLLFDMDDRDMTAFASFSNSLQQKLMGAAEWAKTKGDAFEDDVPWKQEPADEPVF